MAGLHAYGNGVNDNDDQNKSIDNVGIQPPLLAQSPDNPHKVAFTKKEHDDPL